MKKTEFIDEPTRKLIDEYVSHYDADTVIKADDKAVKMMFEQFDDSTLENVFVKSIILNNRYSAGLLDRKTNKERIAIDVYSMSEIIANNIKDCNSINDVINLIEGMCLIVSEKNKNKPYSFLSKYFHWVYAHDEKIAVPIYDGYVKGMIYYLGQKFEYLGSFEQAELNSYKGFYEKYTQTLTTINQKLGTQYTIREFDKYMWKYAKELGTIEPDKVFVDIRI